MKHNKEPPFHLPVIYQDDHLAVVNKPEGVVVFGHKNGGYGRHTVKSALPYVLKPPTLVHRLDRATSGLLVVAKTKAALVHLSHQFKERKAQKLGVCIEGAKLPDNNIDDGKMEAMWQIIDHDLDGQSAVTIWRVLARSALDNAMNHAVTTVELKPKTGRYHQLRRHMAWVSKCNILGDKTYDGGGLAKLLRDEGLYLCSNKITLEHPFYSTPLGKSHWKADSSLLTEDKIVSDESIVSLTEDHDGTVLLNIEIALPTKFHKMIVQNNS
eukprot:CCRYP_003701-RA/>CCRYP_003701-RA protein AED:0.31 eAED:0.31 QI:0/0.33/0.25/1/0.33/0.25/4/20/268